MGAGDDIEAIRDELFRLELALARRRVGELPGGFESVLHPAFHEIGASGRAWTRAATLELLNGAAPTDVPIRRFEVEVVALGVVLATFDTGGDRPARRASLWVLDHGRWRLRFHQGTPL
jgi:ribonuclease HI